MEDNSNKIEYISELLASAFCPELTNDIGFDNIEAQHFKEFRTNLDMKLPHIFDFVQANEEFLHDADKSSTEIQRDLLLLLCEQSAPGTLFQTNCAKFQETIESLLEKHFLILIKNKKLLNVLLQYYEKHLTKENWKKHIGSIHGFHRFCDVAFVRSGISMSQQFSTFTLSVALSLVEFYDPVYKQIGLHLFNIILEATPINEIKETNIHGVIYDTGYSNIQKIDEISALHELWKCLLHCLTLFDVRNYSQWSQLDDLVTALMGRINLVSDTKTCCFLFQNISKIFLMSSSVSNTINNFIDEFEDESLGDLRRELKNMELLASYRHAKLILRLLIAESYRLQTTDNPGEFLNTIHKCYLTSIFHVPMKIIATHLDEFLEKFIPILLDSVSHHKNDPKAKKAVAQFLETFCEQLEELSNHINVSKYKEPIVNIMLHDALQYK